MPKYTLETYQKPQYDTSIIFIHGINSDGDKAWKNKDSGSSWPSLLQTESQFNELGIYVYKYPSNILSRNFSISDVVDNLITYVDIEGLLDTPKLIFVCHSMGGLIARRFLVKKQKELKDIEIGLFLIGSPSLGSEYANYVSLPTRFLGYLQAQTLKSGEDNIWLIDLDKDFMNLKNELGNLTGKELIEDKGFFDRWIGWVWRKPIVGYASGGRYFVDPLKIPGSTHSSIAKPIDKNALQYRVLRDFIHKITEIRPNKYSHDERFQILVALSLINDDNVQIIRETFELTDDKDYFELLHQYQNKKQIVVDSDIPLEELTQIKVDVNRISIYNYLKSYYLDILTKLIKKGRNTKENALINSNTIIAFELIDGFLEKQTDVTLSDLKTIVLPYVISLTHKLINIQRVDDAIKISDNLIETFKKTKEECPGELLFSHSYALERKGQYPEALKIVNELLLSGDSKDECLEDKSKALKASILYRIGKGNHKRNNTVDERLDAKELAEEVMNSKSDWAEAEAMNVLGRFSFDSQDAFYATQSYFDNAAMGWERIDEPIRQLGALTNLAITYDLEGKIKEAEDAFANAINLVKKNGFHGDPVVRLELNQTIFYQELVEHGEGENVDEHHSRIEIGLEKLKKHLKNRSLSNEIKVKILQNLGVHAKNNNEIAYAIELFEEALKLANKSGLLKVQGAALISIAELEGNFNKYEMAIKRFQKAKLDSDVLKASKQYIEFLETKISKAEAHGIKDSELIANLKQRYQYALKIIE